MRVTDVVNVLESLGHYHQTPGPMSIADLTFNLDLDAVLTGPDDGNGLIIVMDASKNIIAAITRRIKSISIVMNRTDSIRPLTLVLINCAIDQMNLDALRELCRVVVIPPDQEPEISLRLLLPLELPLPIEPTASAEQALRDALGSMVNDEYIITLLDAAEKGTDEVKRTINTKIDFIIEKTGSDRRK